MVLDAVQRNEHFIFCRNKKEHVTQKRIQKYFNTIRFQDHPELKAYSEAWVDRDKQIFIRAYDEAGELLNEKYIGFAVALELAENYKSEAPIQGIHHKMYIEEMGNIGTANAETYWRNYQHLVSTYERHVPRFKIIAISNKIDRNNVMFIRYNLPPVDKKFPIDTIRVYHIESDDPDDIDPTTGKPRFSRVAVENVANLGEKSTLLVGAGMGKGITDDDYEEEEHALISDTRNRDIVYRCYLIEDTIKFLMLFVVNKKGHAYWEIYHTNKDLPKNSRIITNYVSTDPLHTQGLIPLSDMEKNLFQYILEGKVFFKTNLVGTEFKRALDRI